MKPVMIISTYPDKESAARVARQLVRDRTCACVNMLEISSVYSWKDSIKDGSEYLAIFKTTADNKIVLEQRIKETHPYDVPEIAAIDASFNDVYLEWLVQSTNRISQDRDDSTQA